MYETQGAEREKCALANTKRKIQLNPAPILEFSTFLFYIFQKEEYVQKKFSFRLENNFLMIKLPKKTLAETIIIIRIS